MRAMFFTSALKCVRRCRLRRCRECRSRSTCDGFSCDGAATRGSSDSSLARSAQHFVELSDCAAVEPGRAAVSSQVRRFEIPHLRDLREVVVDRVGPTFCGWVVALCFPCRPRWAVPHVNVTEKRVRVRNARRPVGVMSSGTSGTLASSTSARSTSTSSACNGRPLSWGGLVYLPPAVASFTLSLSSRSGWRPSRASLWSAAVQGGRVESFANESWISLITSVHSCLNAVLTVALPRRKTCQKTRGMDAHHTSFSLNQHEATRSAAPWRLRDGAKPRCCAAHDGRLFTPI